MSDEELTEDTRPSRGSGLTELMTPQAKAIAAFAFAVFSMLGQGTWSTALTTLFWGSSYDMGAVGNVMVVWGVSCLLMAGLGGWLAVSTLRVPTGTWEANLARAAAMVAAVGSVLAVLTIIGGIVHGT